MKKIIILLILIVFIFSAGAFSVMKEKIISVTGHGEMNIEPNVAYVRFGIEVIENNAKNAQNKNAVKMEKLIKALKNAGIEEEKIETFHFRLEPVKKYSSGADRIVGYRCDNEIKITIDNLGKVGEIIDSGIYAGANKVNSILFTVKDEAKYENMALERAIEDARAKARSIEKAARLQIKRIHSIIEKGARVRPVDLGRGQVYEVSAAPKTKIFSGKIKVAADVLVNFEY